MEENNLEELLKKAKNQKIISNEKTNNEDVFVIISAFLWSIHGENMPSDEEILNFIETSRFNYRKLKEESKN